MHTKLGIHKCAPTNMQNINRRGFLGTFIFILHFLTRFLFLYSLEIEKDKNKLIKVNLKLFFCMRLYVCLVVIIKIKYFN